MFNFAMVKNIFVVSYFLMDATTCKKEHYTSPHLPYTNQAIPRSITLTKNHTNTHTHTYMHAHIIHTHSLVSSRWKILETVYIKNARDPHLLLESRLLWDVCSCLTTTSLGGACTGGSILRHVHIHVFSLSDVLHVFL